MPVAGTGWRPTLAAMRAVIDGVEATSSSRDGLAHSAAANQVAATRSISVAPVPSARATVSAWRPMSGSARRVTPSGSNGDRATASGTPPAMPPRTAGTTDMSPAADRSRGVTPSAASSPGSFGRPARWRASAWVTTRTRRHRHDGGRDGQPVALPPAGSSKGSRGGSGVGRITVGDPSRHLRHHGADVVAAAHMDPEPQDGAREVTPPTVEQGGRPDGDPLHLGIAGEVGGQSDDTHDRGFADNFGRAAVEAADRPQRDPLARVESVGRRGSFVDRDLVARRQLGVASAHAAPAGRSRRSGYRPFR